MKVNYSLPLFLAMTIAIVSCDTNKPIDRNAIKNEMESREIRRVLDSELMTAGEEIGEEISQLAQETLAGELKKAMMSGGPIHAIEYCNLNAYVLVRRLEDNLGVQIKRVSNKLRNPLDAPDSVESLILEAYLYTPEINDAQIQELDTKTLIYTKPIRISNGLCLNCHGTPGEHIQKEHYHKIRELYPNDQAIDYQLDEVRGMWSIRIPKKLVINTL